MIVRMPNVTVIPPSAKLLTSVLALLEPSASDMSRALVVFPGRRPAHFLRKALGERTGGGFIPPRILSYDDFGEFLAIEKLGHRGRSLEPIDAAAILYEAHCAIDDRFGDEEFLSLERFLPLGVRLYDELEELHLAKLSVAEIRSVIGGLTYARLHSIPAYYAKFYEAVSARGFRTRSSSLRAVAEAIEGIDFPEFDRLILAGFYALTAVDQVIFRSLAERPKTVLVFQEGTSLAKHLAQIGIAWEPPAREAPRKAPRVRLCKAPDTHGQVFALGQTLKDLLAAGLPADERTVIVLPSPGALLPVLDHVMPILKPDEYNISLRYPIARTPAYGFLARLMAVVASVDQGKLTLAEYVEFLMHPYTKSIRFGSRTDVTRILVHAIEDVLRRKRSGVSMTLDELEAESAFFQRAVRALSKEAPEVTARELSEHLCWIHDNTIRRFRAIRSIDEFAKACVDVLLFVHERSTADHHPHFRPFVERLIALLRTCSTSLASGHSLGDASAYQRFLRDYVGRSDVPFPGTPLKGVQVLGLLETRNLTFDRVFVLDMSDDVVPGARGAGMFLPQKLREKLGLQTYGDREQLTEYYIDLLREGAQEVTFFFSENARKEKSRFLQKLIWEWEQRDSRPDDGRFVESVRYAVRLANPTPAPIEKTTDVIGRLGTLSYSASSLDRYLACPLRFYYADVLRLRERGVVQADPDPLDVGSIVHEVLARLYGPMLGLPLAGDAFTDEILERAVDGVFFDHFGSPVPGKALLIKRQVRQQLRRFIHDYQIPLLKKHDVTVTDLELELSASIHGVLFEGTIDRVERRAGATVILDYKTGRDGKRFAISPDKLDLDRPETWREAVGSVQLPLYWMLYGAQRGEPVERISPAYLVLGKRDLRENVEVTISSDDRAPEELYALLEAFVIRLVEAIRDPALAFVPAEDLGRVCPACPYQTLCGTQWLLARGNA